MKFVISPDGEVTEIGNQDHDDFMMLAHEEINEPWNVGWIAVTSYGDGLMWVGGTKESLEYNHRAIVDLAIEERIRTIDLMVTDVPSKNFRGTLVFMPLEEFENSDLSTILQRTRIMTARRPGWVTERISPRVMVTHYVRRSPRRRR